MWFWERAPSSRQLFCSCQDSLVRVVEEWAMPHARLRAAILWRVPDSGGVCGSKRKPACAEDTMRHAQQTAKDFHSFADQPPHTKGTRTTGSSSVARFDRRRPFSLHTAAASRPIRPTSRAPSPGTTSACMCSRACCGRGISRRFACRASFSTSPSALTCWGRATGSFLCTAVACPEKPSFSAEGTSSCARLSPSG